MIATWRLNILLTARSLDILLATRGLDIFLATRGLNILLATRGLDIFFTARSLNILLAARGLDILLAGRGLDIVLTARRLHILLTAWRLNLRILASAGQRARRLNFRSLGDLGEHFLRLLDLGRAGRLSVHRGRQGAEHCHAHDRCEKSFHLSPVPSRLLRCGAFSPRLLWAASPPFRPESLSACSKLDGFMISKATAKRGWPKDSTQYQNVTVTGGPRSRRCARRSAAP